MSRTFPETETDIVTQLENVSFADPYYALYRKAADEIKRLRGLAQTPAEPYRRPAYIECPHCGKTWCLDNHSLGLADTSTDRRLPLPVKHYTGMPGATINGETVYDWLMDDGSVEAMTASDVEKCRKGPVSSPVRTFDVMDTIDPDYAESFERSQPSSDRGSK